MKLLGLQRFCQSNKERFRRRVIDSFFSKLDRDGSLFLKYSAYTLKIDRGESSLKLRDYSEIIILMQGPIQKENKKLFWILKNYLFNYQNVIIIISTWEGESRQLAEKVLLRLGEKEKDRVHILVNDAPDYSGIANINMQIVSTFEGLKFAQEFGRKYVLKSRTDQGLLQHDAIEILRRNWSLFNGDEDDIERIVIGSRNTFLFRPYSFSDMLQFGSIEALLLFWQTSFDEKGEKQPRANLVSGHDWSVANLAEVYLVRSYLNRIEVDNEFTFKAHLDALLKCFIVVDSHSLGFIWTKYGYNESPWKEIGFPYVRYEVTHSDWLEGETLLSNWEKLERFSRESWS